jgi:hypothetical protein
MIAHEHELVNCCFGSCLPGTGIRPVGTSTGLDLDSGLFHGAWLAFLFPMAERLDTVVCSIELKILSFLRIRSLVPRPNGCRCLPRFARVQAANNLDVGCAKGSD